MPSKPLMVKEGKNFSDGKYRKRKRGHLPHAYYSTLMLTVCTCDNCHLPTKPLYLHTWTFGGHYTHQLPLQNYWPQCWGPNTFLGHFSSVVKLVRSTAALFLEYGGHHNQAGWFLCVAFALSSSTCYLNTISAASTVPRRNGPSSGGGIMDRRRVVA